MEVGGGLAPDVRAEEQHVGRGDRREVADVHLPSERLDVGHGEAGEVHAGEICAEVGARCHEQQVFVQREVSEGPGALAPDGDPLAYLAGRDVDRPYVRAEVLDLRHVGDPSGIDGPRAPDLVREVDDVAPRSRFELDHVDLRRRSIRFTVQHVHVPLVLGEEDPQRRRAERDPLDDLAEEGVEDEQLVARRNQRPPGVVRIEDRFGIAAFRRRSSETGGAEIGPSSIVSTTSSRTTDTIETPPSPPGDVAPW